MGLIADIWIAASTIVGGVLVRLISDDARAWCPIAQRYLLRCAVQRLPEGQRERYGEEWQAHLDELPGDLTKTVAALGKLIAAWRVAPELAREERQKCPPVVIVASGRATIGPISAQGEATVSEAAFATDTCEATVSAGAVDRLPVTRCCGLRHSEGGAWLR